MAHSHSYNNNDDDDDGTTTYSDGFNRSTTITRPYSTRPSVSYFDDISEREEEEKASATISSWLNVGTTSSNSSNKNKTKSLPSKGTSSIRSSSSNNNNNIGSNASISIATPSTGQDRQTAAASFGRAGYFYYEEEHDYDDNDQASNRNQQDATEIEHLKVNDFINQKTACTRPEPRDSNGGCDYNQMHYNNNNNNSSSSSSTDSFLNKGRSGQQNASGNDACPRKLVIGFLLCAYAFLFFFDPSQPFFVEFLTNIKGIPEDTIWSKIFPIWTYSYIATQFIIGIMTELVGHFFTLLFGLFMGIATVLILLFANKSQLILFEVQEATNAFAFATQTTFSSLVCHLFPSTNYQKMVSLTRGASLLGTGLSAVLGQVLFDRIPLSVLFYINGGTLCACALLVSIMGAFIIRISARKSDTARRPQGMKQTLISLMFDRFSIALQQQQQQQQRRRKAVSEPLNIQVTSTNSLWRANSADSINSSSADSPGPVVSTGGRMHNSNVVLGVTSPLLDSATHGRGSSSSTNSPRIYTTTAISSPPNASNEQSTKGYFFLFVGVVADLLGESFAAYRNSFRVTFWSLCSMTILCIHYLCLTYYQSLFQAVDPTKVFNGYFVAGAYSIACVGAMIPAISVLETVLDRFGFVLPALSVLSSVAMGLCLFFLSTSASLLRAYLLLAAYHFTFEFLFAVSLTQIARSMKKERNDRFAAIFSINSCVSLVLQALVQLMISRKVLALDIRRQFAAFSFCLLACSTLFCIMWGLKTLMYCCTRQQ